MDPQKLSQLDPKLRDAYQRVMGTPIPQPQPASPAGEPVQTQTLPPPPMPIPDPNPSPAPEPRPESIPTSPPTIPEPQPSIPQPEPIPTPEPAIHPQPSTQASSFVQMNSEVTSSQSAPNFSAPAPMPQGQTMAIKKKNGMMIPILFGIAGLVVIAIYTLFWAKIFNFKLPFLS